MFKVDLPMLIYIIILSSVGSVVTGNYRKKFYLVHFSISVRNYDVLKIGLIFLPNCGLF
jgi:hypothetical protein